MATIYIVQSGQTTWQAQGGGGSGRIETVEGVPLSSEGVEQARAAADELSDRKLDAVYAPPSEPERKTANLLAGKLRLRVRTDKRLHEFDHGLWQGLLHEEVRRRQPKVFRQWRRDPGSMRPPGGETLAEAQQRLAGAVGRIARRHKNGAAAVILRPMAAGLVRRLLADEGVGDFWARLGRDARCTAFEIAPEDAARARAVSRVAAGSAHHG